MLSRAITGHSPYRMKTLRLLSLLLSIHSAAFAGAAFPGLKNIMTEAEWKRAGLDRLTPDQIGVIDAALIKHYIQTAPAAASASAASTVQPPPGTTAAEAAAARSRFWEKFGLSAATSAPDWRTQPPMTAKVTGWRGANGFVLDNGQIWEGVEQIPYDLPGNAITIEARPMGAFALKLNDDSVAVRVRRVK
jgi:hypothetical protein